MVDQGPFVTTRTSNNVPLTCSSNNINKYASAHPSGPWRFLRASREPDSLGSSVSLHLRKAIGRPEWSIAGPLVSPTGLSQNLQKKWSLVNFYLCMTQRGVIQVYKVNVNALVARYQHFNRRRVLRFDCSYLSCEGKIEFYYWAWYDLPWDLRGFNAWETLQNREQKQLTVMRNSLFIFKNFGNML